MKKVIIIAFIAIGMVLNVNAQTNSVSTISSEKIAKQEAKDLAKLIECGPINSNTSGLSIRGYVAGGVSGITSNGFGFKGKYDMMESSPIFSYSIGADVQLPLFGCDKFGFRPGLSLQSQGAKFTMDGYDEYDDYDFEIKLLYIKAPVLVEYDVCEKFNLFGGVKLGYLLSGKQEYEDESYDIKDELNSIDFSGTLGAEYKFYCNDKLSLGAGINYDFGFSDIYDNDNEFDNYDKFKNSGLLASISASF